MVAFVAIGNAQLAGNRTRAARHRQLEHDFATIHSEIKEEEREGKGGKGKWSAVPIFSCRTVHEGLSHTDRGGQPGLLRTASHKGCSEVGRCDSKILNTGEFRKKPASLFLPRYLCPLPNCIKMVSKQHQNGVKMASKGIIDDSQQKIVKLKPTLMTTY